MPLIATSGVSVGIHAEEGRLALTRRAAEKLLSCPLEPQLSRSFQIAYCSWRIKPWTALRFWSERANAKGASIGESRDRSIVGPLQKPRFSQGGYCCSLSLFLFRILTWERVQEYVGSDDQAMLTHMMSTSARLSGGCAGGPRRPARV